MILRRPTAFWKVTNTNPNTAAGGAEPVRDGALLRMLLSLSLSLSHTHTHTHTHARTGGAEPVRNGALLRVGDAADRPKHHGHADLRGCALPSSSSLLSLQVLEGP